MSTVAEQLRQAREAKNVSVHEAAEVTKIRTDHIRALEEGRYEVFSAPVYVRGFVRTYAAYLKLEVPKMIDQVNEELEQCDKHREPNFAVSSDRNVLDSIMLLLSKINWKVALPVLALTIIAVGGIYGYRSWAVAKAKNPLADLGPGLYTPAKKSQGETLPLPTPGQ